MPGKGTPRSSFRLTEGDLEILDEAGQLLGTEQRAEAIRLSARYVVDHEKASKKTAKKGQGRASRG